MNHESQLTKIFRRPHIIGIKPIILSKEVRFYDGRVVAEPDILAFTRDGIIQVEYKCNEQRDKAIEQLNIQEEFLRKIGYKGNIQSLYVFGDFQMEEING